MIEELLLSNIRLFEGPQEWRVPISPLTVFCGTNSAGKSTLLKTLLLLCQSPGNMPLNASGRLRLTGGMVDFGSYKSVVSHNETNRDIMLGITVSDTIEFRNLETLYRLREGQTKTELPPSPVSQLEYKLTVRFRCGVGHPDPADTAPTHRKRSAQQVFLKEANFDFESENDLQLSWRVVADEESSRHYLLMPREYFGASQEFRFMENSISSDVAYSSFEVLLRGMVPIGLWARAKGKKVKAAESEVGWSFFPLPPLVSETIRNLELELDRVHYLGPLRSPARRYYMTHLEVDPTMDAAGEFLPYVLRDQRDQDVFYVAPKGGTEFLANRFDTR